MLADLGVAAPVEPYTEIAFATPDALPTSDGVLRVPFTVRNGEGAARTYAWTATTRPAEGAATTVATGRLSLADGASATVRARIPVTCAGGRTRVDISLGGAHRTIGFWLACDGGTP